MDEGLQWRAGLIVAGRDVASSDRREVRIDMLHRMVVYARQEAMRLHVMDVALLLRQAEDAITGFHSATLDRHGIAPPILDATRIEH